MKEKLLCVFYFCMIFKCFHGYESDYYSPKPDYQNKTYQETPIIDTINPSAIQCSSICSETPGCSIIFFNKISGKCKVFQAITDEKNFVYSGNTYVYEKVVEIPVTTEVPIPVTTKCPYTTSVCGKLSYIKIDTATDISPCFKVYTTNIKTHPNAKAYCQSENSRLIVLSDSGVSKLIRSYISCVCEYDMRHIDADISPSSNFWLGLEYDPISGQFKWYDNIFEPSVSYTSGNECGKMYRTGFMYAGYCPGVENFICESLT